MERDDVLGVVARKERTAMDLLLLCVGAKAAVRGRALINDMIIMMDVVRLVLLLELLDDVLAKEDI
jgi:hypothetical protein